jgi:hypothetical protein
MERERRTEVAAAEDPLHAPEAQENEGHAHFHAGGALPAVAENVAPPPPTASERAFGPSRGAGARAGAAEPGVMNRASSITVNGIVIIAPAGVHVAALEQVAAIVRQELGNNKYAQRKLAEAYTRIVIIPANTKMTDLPEFAGMRGTNTDDGRLWDNVRGSGGRAAPNGTFAIGVAEEDLVSVRGVVSQYARGYSIAMHELAHTVEGKGMTPDQHARLLTIYQRQQQKDAAVANTHHDAFTDNYGARNVREYFAQATNAFFGRNQGAEKQADNTIVQNHNGRAWLQANDPDMYAFLVEMYETPRDADGNVVPARPH